MSKPITDRILHAYRHLLQAEVEKRTVSPLTEIYPELTVDEAYEVQLTSIAKKVEQGQQVVGKKIGLTSLAMQKLLGVDQPDYGHLLDEMDVPNHSSLFIDRLFQPKVEAELAFVLKKELRGPAVTIEDVLEATAYIVPAIEIVDSRIADWKVKLQDTIADNASCGLFILGDQKLAAKGKDLREVEMSLYRNGELMNTGSGAAVLGHPAACVAWLANKLHQYNVVLKAGEVILSGALSAAVNAEKGDRFTADFDQLGKVEVTFN